MPLLFDLTLNEDTSKDEENNEGPAGEAVPPGQQLAAENPPLVVPPGQLPVAEGPAAQGQYMPIHTYSLGRILRYYLFNVNCL